MYCNNCGNQIDDRAVVCPYCGVPTQSANDKGGFGWALLGCCIPLVGIILFFIWKDTKPNTAKALIVGAGVSIAFAVVSNILVAITGAGAVALGLL